MSKIKALLLDPLAGTISEIEINKANGLQDYYEQLQCRCFAVPMTLSNGDSLYCDDEGAFKEGTGATARPDWNYPILGRCLLVGTDLESGEAVDVKTTAKEAAQMYYYRIEGLGFVPYKVA